MKMKRWVTAEPDAEAVRSLAAACGFSPLAAAALCAGAGFGSSCSALMSQRMDMTMFDRNGFLRSISRSVTAAFPYSSKFTRMETICCS